MPKTLLRHVVPVLLGLLLIPLVAAPAAWAQPENLEVELVAETTTVQPGSSVLVGIRLAIEEHWHVYWKNPGETGTPVGIKWDLPKGWRAGPILWPAPKALPLGTEVAYAYEGTFVLPVRIDAPADAPEGEVSLPATVDWLVCDHQQCEPGGAERTLVLKVSKAAAAPGPHQELFDAAKAAWPKAFPAGVTVSARAVEKATELVVTGPGPWLDPASKLYAFLERDGAGSSEQLGADPAAEQQVTRAGETTTLRLQLPKKRKKSPETLLGMLVVEDAKGRTVYALVVPVGATSPGPGEVPPSMSAAGGEAPPEGVDDEKQPFWLLLVGALVGGMILNIMPCVLPVLSIKVLGFVSQADEHPALVRRHAYVFAAGVLASFWVLAGIVLGIRAWGEQLGWGFQFQNPVFVSSMAVLMFIVGVNLAGVFEIGLSVQSLAGDAATKIHSSGLGASFWSGALATVIATPCTAPMMGPAIGYAMTAPVIECLLVFTMLGVGMALPYVLLSMSPRLLKKVPRPGPWMETFKHALAFPMFATVIYLGFVLADHIGAAGVLWFFMALLVLGLALWIYGNWGTPSTAQRKRWIVGYGFAFLAALGAFRLIQKALAQQPAAEQFAAAPKEGEVFWEKWSKARLAEALAEGKVVFVDFTAKWCVSCQANEAAFIDTDGVREAIDRLGVVMLKADWTRPNEAIRLGLAEFGRSSVPLYLVYSPHRPTARPEVLPTALTSSGQVIEALERAAAK